MAAFSPPAILLAPDVPILTILAAWLRFARQASPFLVLLSLPFYVLWNIPLYLGFW